MAARSGSACFPDKPITKKPLEVRQGKGKGNVEYWVCQIQPGRVLYEMEGVTEEIAREAFRLAAAKLPFPTTFVSTAGDVMEAADLRSKSVEELADELVELCAASSSICACSGRRVSWHAHHEYGRVQERYCHE